MQVFISHATADRPVAEDLMAEFEKAGIKAWDPYRSLYPGDNWALEIGKALESSDVMVEGNDRGVGKSGISSRTHRTKKDWQWNQKRN